MTSQAAVPEDAGPYGSLEERAVAQRLGMFVFLGSETLLFAGLFALYVGYRAEYAQVFTQAVGFNEEWIGSVNTFILLSSSFLVAWADLSFRRGRAGLARICLVLACGLGLAFLGLKLLEYTDHWEHGIRPGTLYAFKLLDAPGAALFFTLYYLMTALHALHVIAGLLALVWTASTLTQPPHRQKETRLELSALYWHLVDVVWIFLWPLLYLMH